MAGRRGIYKVKATDFTIDRFRVFHNTLFELT